MPPSLSRTRRRSGAPHRDHTLLPAAPALALALVLAVAPAVAAGPSAARPTPRDHLVITADDGSGSLTTYTLHCHPFGGTHPAPRAACKQLDRLGGPLGPVPRARMCTQFFGGPQTAHLIGLWRGRYVDQTYRHSNGCEVDRWQSMEPVLPDMAAH